IGTSWPGRKSFQNTDSAFPACGGGRALPVCAREAALGYADTAFRLAELALNSCWCLSRSWRAALSTGVLNVTIHQIFLAAVI
ncbi:hypothetical protein, partial [Rhizobium sp. 12,4]|uniref:hypothetical protein n=1 Tax=Rhizobium sp. 12,4 TaxID=3405135 RepID=UPI003D348F1A